MNGKARNRPSRLARCQTRRHTELKYRSDAALKRATTYTWGVKRKMAKQVGDDLILKAVSDVADLREHYAEFAEELTGKFDEVVKQMTAMSAAIVTHSRRIDARFASLGTVLGAIAREGKSIRSELAEHDERLRRLERSRSKAP